MIVEGLLTTIGDNGEPHVAPMGPLVSKDFTTWTLRPFQSSSTFRYLRAKEFGVFHIVDDVRPVVRRALGFDHPFVFEPHPRGGHIIQDACRWFRLEVTQWNVDDIRSEATARVESQAELRPFWGWNRAKHAVLEATILLTRRHLIPVQEIAAKIAELETAVEKTAGAAELEAWGIVKSVLDATTAETSAGNAGDAR